jgi:hypothetical protein
METLPERINVIRSITYDVQSVIKDLEELGVETEWATNLDTIMHYIAEWVEEDMRAPISRHDITYLDENGQEL